MSNTQRFFLNISVYDCDARIIRSDGFILSHSHQLHQNPVGSCFHNVECMHESRASASIRIFFMHEFAHNVYNMSYLITIIIKCIEYHHYYNLPIWVIQQCNYCDVRIKIQNYLSYIQLLLWCFAMLMFTVIMSLCARFGFAAIRSYWRNENSWPRKSIVNSAMHVYLIHSCIITQPPWLNGPGTWKC